MSDISLKVVTGVARGFGGCRGCQELWGLQGLRGVSGVPAACRLYNVKK